MAAARDFSQDALSCYLSRLRFFSRLTKEEELELARHIGHGQRNALNELIQSNLSFVVKVANEYRGLGLPFEDLINEGNVGLIEAAQRFDPGRNTRFITYAVWWIRKTILKAIVNHANVVRIPRYRLAEARALRAAEAVLRRELGRNPRREEVSARLATKPSKVDALRQTRRREVSLDEKVGEQGNRCVADLVENDTAPSAEQKAIRREARAHLCEAMDRLTDREKLVLAHRFGLDGQPCLTLKELGRKLRLSRERVRQIETEARIRLRKYFKQQSVIRAPSRGPLPCRRTPRSSPQD